MYVYIYIRICTRTDTTSIDGACYPEDCSSCQEFFFATDPEPGATLIRMSELRVSADSTLEHGPQIVDPTVDGINPA